MQQTSKWWSLWILSHSHSLWQLPKLTYNETTFDPECLKWTFNLETESPSSPLQDICTDTSKSFKCHLLYLCTYWLSSCVSSGQAKQILVPRPLVELTFDGCRGSAQADQHQSRQRWVGGGIPVLCGEQSLSKLPQRISPGDPQVHRTLKNREKKETTFIIQALYIWFLIRPTESWQSRQTCTTLSDTRSFLKCILKY